MYRNGDGDGKNLCSNEWGWGQSGTDSKFTVMDGDRDVCPRVAL